MNSLGQAQLHADGKNSGRSAATLTVIRAAERTSTAQILNSAGYIQKALASFSTCFPNSLSSKSARKELHLVSFVHVQALVDVSQGEVEGTHGSVEISIYNSILPDGGLRSGVYRSQRAGTANRR